MYSRFYAGWLALLATTFLVLAASPNPSPSPSPTPSPSPSIGSSSGTTSGTTNHPAPVAIGAAPVAINPAPVATSNVAVPTPAASTGPVTYLIHPYGVTDQCLGYADAGPFNGQYLLNAVMDSCVNNKNIWAFHIINYNDASDWDGKSDAKVVIKAVGLGDQCLENALADGLPPDGGDWEYEGCASKTPTSRYVFHISVNGHGAVQIQSDRDQKCLERNGPNNVLALPCPGVNNWMVERLPGL